MDYMKLLRSLSKRAANTYCYCASSAVFVSAALLVGLPVIAQADVLKINDSVINLSGDLSATVTHTADGMEIQIPGVEISLDCETRDCTVTIGSNSGSTGSNSGSTGSNSGSTGSGSGDDSGSGGGDDSGSGGGDDSGSGSGDDSGSGTGSSGSGSSSSGSDDDSDSDGDADCDPALDFGCGASYGNDDDSSSGSGDSGGNTGDTTGTTSISDEDEDEDEDDPCSGTGYNPACNANAVASNSAPGAFPTGSARKIDNKSASLNFGSANTTPKTKLTVESGVVTVLGLTMGTGNSPSSGTVDFAQGSNVQGVALRAWISATPDGDRVGATCSYSGYPEGNVRFTIGETSSCSLSAGGTYYFNMALCSSTPSDLYCKQSGAQAATAGGIMKVSASYSD